MSTAMLIYSYGMPSLDVHLATVARYIPESAHIYILNVVEPYREARRQWITDCAAKYLPRAPIFDLGAQYSNPRAIEFFCKEHPQYDMIWKTDDDIFYTTEDTWEGVHAAYNQVEGSLFACGLTPVQRWIFKIIVARLGAQVDDRLMIADLVRTLQKEPDRGKLIDQIWDVTFPPQKVLRELRERTPRVITVPQWEMTKKCSPKLPPKLRLIRWSAGHYLVSREDLLRAFANERRGKEEVGLHTITRREARGIVIDTHNLVYHLAWHGAHQKYAVENILPRIRESRYWEH